MIRGASVIGREHVRLGKNNQDAWATAEHRGVQAIVVADGCSSEKHSEVGAKLGSRWLAHWVVTHAEGLNEAFAVCATEALSQWLHTLATPFTSGRDATAVALRQAQGERETGGVGPSERAPIQAEPVEALAPLPLFVHDYLLFTFLCAVRRGAQSLVFGMGDGVVLIDDQLLVLDSGPENAPNYVGYRLVNDTRGPQVHFAGEAARIALMTDGFESCSAQVPGLVTGLGKNPLSLQRRLNVFSQTQRLGDDATIALLSEEAA